MRSLRGLIDIDRKVENVEKTFCPPQNISIKKVKHKSKK